MESIGKRIREYNLCINRISNNFGAQMNDDGVDNSNDDDDKDDNNKTVEADNSDDNTRGDNDDRDDHDDDDDDHDDDEKVDWKSYRDDSRIEKVLCLSYVLVLWEIYGQKLY